MSPEYYVEQTQTFLLRAKPASALMLVHNGDNPNVRRLARLHPRLHFSALAPHVAASARSLLRVCVDVVFFVGGGVLFAAASCCAAVLWRANNQNTPLLT